MKCKEGQRFGKLIVIKYDCKKKSYQRKFPKEGWKPVWCYSHYWQCRCDCGKEKSIRQNHLTQKIVKSCGCIKRGKNSIHWQGCGDISGYTFCQIKSKAKEYKNEIISTTIVEIISKTRKKMCIN